VSVGFTAAGPTATALRTLGDPRRAPSKLTTKVFPDGFVTVTRPDVFGAFSADWFTDVSSRKALSMAARSVVSETVVSIGMFGVFCPLYVNRRAVPSTLVTTICWITLVVWAPRAVALAARTTPALIAVVPR